MPTESYYTATLTAELRKLSAEVIPLVAGVRGIAGMPDRYVVHSIWAGFLECKGENTRLTKLQAYLHRQMNRQRAGTVYVVRYLSRTRLQIEYDSATICQLPFDALALLERLEEYTLLIGGRG